MPALASDGSLIANLGNSCLSFPAAGFEGINPRHPAYFFRAMSLPARILVRTLSTNSAGIGWLATRRTEMARRLTMGSGESSRIRNFLVVSASRHLSEWPWILLKRSENVDRKFLGLFRRSAGENFKDRAKRFGGFLGGQRTTTELCEGLCAPFRLSCRCPSLQGRLNAFVAAKSRSKVIYRLQWRVHFFSGGQYKSSGFVIVRARFFKYGNGSVP